MTATRMTRTDSSTQPKPNVTPRPNVPLRPSELEWESWSEGKRFAGSEIPLGKWGGSVDIGVNLMEIPPGKQSCPLHWHMREEEHFYVLSGCCILRTHAASDTGGDDIRREMCAGDYVCFPAGTRVAHAFENPFPTPCRILAIGARDDNEVAVYPDSGKAKLRGLGLILPVPEEGLDYWQDEPTDPVPPIGVGC